jgi:hypothetical protein
MSIFPANIKRIEQGTVPKGVKYDYFKKIGHFVLAGKLAAEGRLVVGRCWARFSGRAGQNYLLEMKDGFPEKIYFPADGKMVEFLKIIDNRTGETTGVHIGQIRREVFRGFSDHTVEARLDGSGHLGIGGKREDLTGNIAAHTRAWKRFYQYPNEKIRVLVIDGAVRQVTILRDQRKYDLCPENETPKEGDQRPVPDQEDASLLASVEIGKMMESGQKLIRQGSYALAVDMLVEAKKMADFNKLNDLGAQVIALYAKARSLYLMEKIKGRQG